VAESTLSQNDRTDLLKLARSALEAAVRGKKVPPLDLQQYPRKFGEPGATFVTLTRSGQLRGCIGALEAYQPLAEDVQEHAVAAALQDYRFPPVRPDELDRIEIEISRLTEPQPLVYTTPEDLLRKLHPGVDGVILKDGFRRATFLPQVWEKIPDPVDFLGNLCYKMGAEFDLWQHKHLEVFIYQVEEFHE
jgi:AmmeMemoRadiSam system protein A